LINVKIRVIDDDVVLCLLYSAKGCVDIMVLKLRSWGYVTVTRRKW
jgi:hypothetical protein